MFAKLYRNRIILFCYKIFFIFKNIVLFKYKIVVSFYLFFDFNFQNLFNIRFMNNCFIKNVDFILYNKYFKISIYNNLIVYFINKLIIYKNFHILNIIETISHYLFSFTYNFQLFF